MRLISPAFKSNQSIPQKYGRDFENVNPPLEIKDVPENTKSLVLLMDDPDVPEAAGVPVWDHWVVFNIEPTITQVPENWTVQGTRGAGTRGELDYGGPRPPDREHRYFFKLYALDATLDLVEGVSKSEVFEAMKGHIIESAELMGKFAPQK
ncbi:YbhB/YbcL family Raf kinase inhibitor-like protein [Patescibacteria group bacterium]